MGTFKRDEPFSILGQPFPASGPLKHHCGLLYVKIDNKIRRALFDALIKEKALAPYSELLRIPQPPECEDKDIGAHVSVLDQREMEDIPEAQITEIAKRLGERTIQFEALLGIKKLNGTTTAKYLWIVELASAELETIRVKEFGLSPKPNKNRFHFHLSIAEVPLSDS